MNGFLHDQAGSLRARVAALGSGERRALPHVVTVTSGKGGVGKTALVANLGLELSRRGMRVVLLDGDLGLANLAIVFNLAPRRDLLDVLEGRCGLADVALDVRPNLRLIPAAGGAAALADLDEAEREGLLADLEPVTAEADFLLVDTGAGISATVLALVAMADQALVVTTHEPTALSDAYGLIKAARARGARQLDLVVNLAVTHAQARDTHARLGQVTSRFLGFVPGLAAVIPRDECVGQAIARQEPMSIIYPYAQASRAVAALARHLLERPGMIHGRTSISLALPVRG